MRKMLTMTTLFKNHSGTIGSYQIWTDGATVHVESCKKLGGKAVPSQYEAKGKNIGKANETTPAEQAVLEMESKIRAKLDKGYVRTIEEAQAPATNSLGLEKPMLATPIEKVKPEKIDWSTACVQPKLDGHRALYKDGVLYSRQGKVLEHMDHIVHAIESSGLKDFHLDGELYLHGIPLQELSRRVKKFRGEETLEVEYHIYDWVCDLPFMERIGILALHRQEMQWDNVLQYVQTDIVESLEDAMLLHEVFRVEGYEGTMLRFSNDPYGTDKRSRTLLKIKEFHDAEFEVVGSEEGKPRHANGGTYRVPVWVCKTPDGDFFNVTAQGDMYAKEAQFRQRDTYVGKQLTVKYHYLSKDGIPQLPIALRWREDV